MGCLIIDQAAVDQLVIDLNATEGISGAVDEKIDTDWFIDYIVDGCEAQRGKVVIVEDLSTDNSEAFGLQNQVVV